MNESEIRQVLHSLDHALNVFRQNEGHLTAAEVRARSLLSVTRADLAQALSDACHQRDVSTELFIDGKMFAPNGAGMNGQTA